MKKININKEVSSCYHKIKIIFNFLVKYIKAAVLEAIDNSLFIRAVTADSGPFYSGRTHSLASE